MGQAECLEILEKEKRWMVTAEICKILNQIPGVVNRSLNKLYEQGLIERGDIKPPSRGFEWKFSQHG